MKKIQTNIIMSELIKMITVEDVKNDDILLQKIIHYYNMYCLKRKNRNN